MSQGGGQFIRLKAERAGLALVGNFALRVDQVDTIGPAGVRSLRGIAEFIEHSRKLQAELAHADAGDGCAFFSISWAREDDFVSNIAFHLPQVAGMGF